MESISNNIEELEERLDAHFKDKKVLETALTQSSMNVWNFWEMQYFSLPYQSTCF